MKNFLSKIKFKSRWTWYKLYDLFFPKIEIDRRLIDKLINQYDLGTLTDELRIVSYHKGDSLHYFNNFLRYNKTDEFFPDNPFFLYPPNVAVIDYLCKNFSRDVKIVDYACGLGNLQKYLRRIGFHNSYGFDNHSQISKKTIEDYLGKNDIMLDKVEGEFEVVTCIGYFWKLLDNPKKGKYLLIDYHYSPRYIKGYKLIAIYDKLLLIFKKSH